MFEAILVPIDPVYLALEEGEAKEHPCGRAIETASWLAKQTRGSRMQLLTVVDEPPQRVRDRLGDEFDQQIARADENAELHLSRLATALEMQGIDASTAVRHGEPWREICAAASDFDIVIAGTRPHSAIERFLFGSTGFRLLRHCPCAVWLSKKAPHADDGVVDVLAAVDFGEMGEAITNAAVDLSRNMEGRLHLLHACEEHFRFTSRLAGLSPSRHQELDDDSKAEAEQQLQEMLEMTDYRTIEGGVQVFTPAGRAEHEILHHLEQHEIDLLVMGTVGRRGLRGFFVGNTAERILNSANCSVLVFKPEGFRDEDQ